MTKRHRDWRSPSSLLLAALSVLVASILLIPDTGDAQAKPAPTSTLQPSSPQKDDPPGRQPRQATATAVPPTSTPTATAVAPTATATPTQQPTVGSPTASPSPAGSGTATPTPAGSPSPTPTAGSPTPTPTAGSPTPTTTTGPTGTVTVTASPTPTPKTTPSPTPGSGALSNDDFDAATSISSFPYTAVQETGQATSASDDPLMGPGMGANSNTVWFTLMAPGNGSLRVSTAGSSYDTVLAAFTGSRGSLSLVASNDDTGSSVQSEMLFDVQSGTTYYLEVAQYGTPGGGTLQLTVEYSSSPAPTATLIPSPTPLPTYSSWYWPSTTPLPTATPAAPPPNDDFGSAITIGGFPFTSNVDTRGATSASDDPAMTAAGERNSNTVWYRLVAPADGSVHASTIGSSYDTVLAVFTGTRGRLALLATNDDSGAYVQSDLVFNVQSGVTYYLEVAQYGAPGGGDLTFTAQWSNAQIAATITATPWATGALVPLGTPDALVAGMAPSAAASGREVQRDARFFQITGYRVNLDPFWDYFNRRGGVRTFGYPVSWEFSLLGFRVQLFQRALLQLNPDGSAATMNLLDGGLMPYTRINGSSFPEPDRELVDAAPSPSDRDYGSKAIAFIHANVPNQWEGMPVRFLEAFMDAVRYEDAFPEGDGSPELLPLLNLEIFGLPTSRPTRDPANGGFVYQRFQRGILMYDSSTGLTQPLLLADYLKSIMTGRDLPPDLEQQAIGSPFYRQYDLGKPRSLARPAKLPGTDLEGAFEPVLLPPATNGISSAKPAVGREATATPTATRAIPTTFPIR